MLRRSLFDDLEKDDQGRQLVRRESKHRGFPLHTRFLEVADPSSENVLGTSKGRYFRSPQFDIVETQDNQRSEAGGTDSWFLPQRHLSSCIDLSASFWRRRIAPGS